MFILDYPLYEGTWIRSSDGAKIKCRFRVDGKLKCQWEEGGPQNLLLITNSTITWDKDRTITGSYSDGSICWTNKNTWIKEGKHFTPDLCPEMDSASHLR